jgi:hypothetical protein
MFGSGPFYQKPDSEAIKDELHSLATSQERNVNNCTIGTNIIEETNMKLRTKIGEILRTGTPIITPSGQTITALDPSQGSIENEARYLIGIAKAALQKK